MIPILSSKIFSNEVAQLIEPTRSQFCMLIFVVTQMSFSDPATDDGRARRRAGGLQLVTELNDD